MKLQKTDIPKLLMLIRVNFENAYNFKTEDEAKLLVEYWYECLKDYPQEVVYKAFDNAIRGSEFAPKLSNIIAEADKLVNADKKTDEELWSELCGKCWLAWHAMAYCNPAYPETTQQEGQRKLQEIWDNTSPEIKAYVVDEASLAEIGGMDRETLQYEKARFLKAMPRIRETLKNRQVATQFLQLTDAGDLIKLLGSGRKE